LCWSRCRWCSARCARWRRTRIAAAAVVVAVVAAAAIQCCCHIWNTQSRTFPLRRWFWWKWRCVGRANTATLQCRSTVSRWGCYETNGIIQ
jgi:hypothetical protein